MKRILAVFLTLAMALNIAPMAAFAAADSDAASIVAVDETDETSSSQLDEETARAIASDPFLQAAYAQTEQEQTGRAEVDTSNMSVSATNSFGQLLVNGMEGQSTDADGSTNRITNVTMNGRTANVQFVLDGTADLMVAIYTDSTEEELVASGTTEVSGNADNGAAQVSIVGDIPETYTIKAFLLDKTDHSPLSSAYTDVSHTQVMVDLDKATVDDFEENRTVNLDTDKNTNFAVVKQDVTLVKQEDAAGKNTILEQDDDGLNYTIANASAEIKNLQAGDILTYEYAEGELLVVRVENITKEGDTVKIHGDDTLELTDVFDAVKIESEESGEGMTYDGTDADADVTYTGMMEGDLEEGIDFEEAEDEENGDPEVVTKKIGFTFSISTDTFGNKTDTGTDKDKEDTGYVEKAKATGTYRFSGDIKVKWYLADDEQMASITTEFEQVFTLEVTDAITRDIRLGRLGGRPIPGVFIGVEPTLKFKAEAKGSFAVSRKESATEEYSSRNNYVTQTNTDPEIKVSAKLEGSLYLGVDLGPTVRIGGKLIVAKVVLEGGVKGTATVADWADTTGETKHACDVCFQISVEGELKCGASFTFLYGIGKFEKMAAEISIPVWEGYWSATHKKLGIGSCPYKAYRVLVGVSGKAEAGIQIAQGTMAEYQAGTAQVLGVTGTTGLYPIYLEPGRYTITAIVNGQPYGQSTFNVEKAARTVLIAAGISAEPDTGTGGTDSPDNPDTPDEDEEYNISMGVLNIKKASVMVDYETADAAPWSAERDAVTRVNVDKSILRISRNALAQFANLKEVYLNGIVTEIAENAFANSTLLKDVYYAGTVAEWNAVQVGAGNDVLEKATIHCSDGTAGEPERIVASGTCGRDVTWKLNDTGTLIIEGTGFMTRYRDATAMGEAIHSHSDAPWDAKKDDIKQVVIREGVTSIGSYAFNCFYSLTDVVIPESMEWIDEDAFYGCDSLITVSIPKNVDFIGSNAFYKCDGMTDIEIPKNGALSYIGKEAFYKCSSLKNISIPDTVTAIGTGAFSGCSSLTDVALPYGVTKIEDELFWGCENLTSVVLPDGVTSIGARSFRGCRNLTDPVLPDGVTSIGAGAFSGCKKMTNITIPVQVTVIGEEAFAGCNGLTKVTIPGGVTSISEGAFSYCGNLTNVTIPDGVENIGKYAFKDCNSLASITIPDSIKTIGYMAFDDCGNLANVTYTGTMEQWTQISIDTSNGGRYGELLNASIHCSDSGSKAFGPCGTDTLWTLDENGTLVIQGTGRIDWSPWSKQKEQIRNVIIKYGVKDIGESAFSGCTNLISVTIPESVTCIGNGVFEECDSLTSITIPGSVTSVGDSAFYGCDSLTSVTILNGVESIGNGAFSQCGHLTNVALPKSVVVIGFSAFKECNSLTDVYYSGTKEQWNNISIRSYNTPLTSASIHCTGTASENSITTGTASTSGSKLQATFADAKAGKEYVVLVSRSDSDPLNADNLIYINQITADADGELTVPFITAADAAEMTYVVACAQDSAPVDPDQPVDPGQPDQPSSGDGGGAIILIGGVAAVAAVAGVVLLMPVKVEGTVKLADQPVANATVQVLKGDAVKAETVTDANGHFTVKVKRGGYTLRVQWTDVSGQPVTRTVDFKAPNANLNVAA